MPAGYISENETDAIVSVGEGFGARWFTAGPRSRAGHPHHPLYLKKDSPLDPFTDLKEYLRHLDPGREA